MGGRATGKKMPKMETCPNCSAEVDIKSILRKKKWSLFNPFQFSLGKKLEDFDLITCPFCKTKFRTDKAKIFGFKPMQIYWFLILYIGFAIFMAILLLLNDIFHIF